MTAPVESGTTDSRQVFARHCARRAYSQYLNMPVVGTNISPCRNRRVAQLCQVVRLAHFVGGVLVVMYRFKSRSSCKFKPWRDIDKCSWFGCRSPASARLRTSSVAEPAFRVQLRIVTSPSCTLKCGITPERTTFRRTSIASRSLEKIQSSRSRNESTRPQDNTPIYGDDFIAFHHASSLVLHSYLYQLSATPKMWKLPTPRTFSIGLSLFTSVTGMCSILRFIAAQAECRGMAWLNHHHHVEAWAWRLRVKCHQCVFLCHQLSRLVRVTERPSMRVTTC